jgi:hypothetical protein
MAWSPVLKSPSPTQQAVILAIGGQGKFLSFFAVETNRNNFENNYKVRLIARIPHGLKGFVHAIAFASMSNDNAVHVASAGSSGAIQQIRLRFEFRESGVACVFEERREVHFFTFLSDAYFL